MNTDFWVRKFFILAVKGTIPHHFVTIAHSNIIKYCLKMKNIKIVS